MRISTKSKYIAYIAILHLVLILLVYKLLFENKALFIASEVFLLLSAGASIVLYNNFMQPIQFVKSGIEAIKDKDFSIKFVPTGKGEVDILIEVYNLMIDQLREERIRLNEQHFFLEKLIEASPISIIILDYDDRIESLNSKGKSQFEQGGRELAGKKLDETDLALLSELAGILDGESRLIKTNGIATFKAQRSHFMDRGFRRSFLMIEELTNEILESEKNAYGKVIRMMAHEVNNTLGATDSILQTTTHLLPDTDYRDIKDALSVVSERNQRLTRFMRNFADVVRLPAPVPERTDMGALTRDVAVFMQNAASVRNVLVQSDLDENVFWNVDKGQMEQVLINVIKNAVEACESGQEVRIYIASDRLVIRNNGKPIDPEVSTKLFNPFFSTKRDGQGIGLTLTREILGNHGFGFALETRADGWTEFRIETS
ncbi:sensor histidine kinase [Dyadobacter fermentans]|uniref:histidine kinase n=1 Tax=Dyadobacter fermentans (strain ATCC 700827 / DSM 18053 / CIP 107007 / KCTC 52180 / NS114) TaxID=471854 RepID=C6VWQ5_DYAFD|nr:ATP-binding protein [Dyadobacter fermentans]ACT96805.1 histidine kinase [Dyadobacter fermentans DSM 18053]